MDKNAKIEFCTLFILVGFMAAVVFHYLLSAYFHNPYPLNTFLFRPGAQFSDYISVYISNHDLSPYRIRELLDGAVYFPWAYILIVPFMFLPKIIGAELFVVISTLVLIGFCHFYFRREPRSPLLAEKYLNIKNIFIFSIMTYPVLFSIERANLEFLLFLQLAFFLFFYTRKDYFISAIFLASATAMKMYPGVFVLLFLLDKRYKEAFFCVALILMMSLSSLLLLKGGGITVQLKSFSFILNWYNDTYVRSYVGMQHNSSLFTFYNVFFNLFSNTKWPPPLIDKEIVKIFAIAGMVFFLALAICMWNLPLVFWKRVALLTACMLLLPHISFDYKLLHVYLPLFFFMNAAASTKRSDMLYTIIFCLLFIPKNYLLLYGEYSISSVLNTVLFLLLIIFILAEGFYYRSLSSTARGNKIQ